MKINEVKSIVLDAVNAKENSDDDVFAETLQTEIEAFCFKFTQIMGKPIDDFSDQKDVSQEVEKAVHHLHTCYSM